MDPITQGIIINLLSKSIEKIGEKFGENTSKQLANFNDKHKSIVKKIFTIFKPSQEEPFPKDFETAIKEMEAAANQDPKLKQDIIDVVAVATDENPTEIQSIKDELNRNKLQEITAKKNNAVLQGNNISGGNVGNTGGFQGSTINIQGDMNF